MIRITRFEDTLARLLPETHALLRSANLVLHPAVARITLHGSRGLAGGYRQDSDVDLCLIVDSGRLPPEPGRAALLRSVLATTLACWQGRVEADLAAVFDARGCGLRCFERAQHVELDCGGGVDCFGLYKVQRGFDGYAAGSGLQVGLMYPCLTIWRDTARVATGCGQGQEL